ncbi:MAG: hypothetical protein ACLT76_02875 [Clostridium fessum]
MVMLALGVYLIWPGANFDVSQTDYTLLSRIQQKNMEAGKWKSL